MAGDSMSPKQGLVIVRAVLAATIRVQQHLFFRLPACKAISRTSMHQGLLHPMMHRPTEDSARIKIEHGGQIPPSLGRPHVGHVRAPVPIGAIRGELAIQMVRDNRQSMTTAGNQPPALARTNTQAGFAHQSSNSVSTTSMPYGRQLGLDSAMSIDPIHLMVDGSDLLAQTPIRYLSRRGRPLLPGRETAARYLQQPAHQCYGIATGQRLYGAKLHFVGCEKMASALFSTSRYMVTCPNCSRKRRSSAFSLAACSCQERHRHLAAHTDASICATCFQRPASRLHDEAAYRKAPRLPPRV